MRKMRLGQSEIRVSEWCLGTMTFGNQTPEAEAHAQIDRALDAGIDFLDCAEIYPVNPVTRQTAGRSEEIIGTWLARRRRRDDVVIATKVASTDNVIRGDRGPDREVIIEAVEGSLRRMQTEVIDLYQIHWPARGGYAFRKNWHYDPSRQNRNETIAHMDEVIDTLDGLVEAGKIRAFGLSNETAWGTLRWIDRAAASGGPRVASVQNEYSLLCRLFDTDMAEMAVNEDVTLLSYSPLAAGYLSGKYQDGVIPAGSRMSLNPTMGGRRSDRVSGAVAAYLDIARRFGIDPVHMALAWQKTRPFSICPIFGATTVEQLDHILAGLELRLGEEVIKAIEAAHKAHPMPY